MVKGGKTLSTVNESLNFSSCAAGKISELNQHVL